MAEMGSVAAMFEINASKEINASVDRVWEIVSDLNSEPLFWSDLHAVYNISWSANFIQKEVTASFRHSKVGQIMELPPKKSVEVTLTQGPMKGNRIITLIPFNDETTKVTVSWNVKLSSIPILLRGLARERIAEGTREALDRIANAVE